MRSYTVREAHERWASGSLVIIDIREEPEHAETRVAGLALLPMSEILERLDELPPDRELAMFCRTGSRSAFVADHLTALGDWGEVANVEGGIIAWAADGLPYEGNPPT